MVRTKIEEGSEAVHASWDNLMAKRSGCKRWWESSKDGKSSVKTVEELCERILTRDEDRQVGGFSRTEGEDRAK